MTDAPQRCSAATVDAVAAAIMTVFIKKWFLGSYKGPVYLDCVNGEKAWQEEAKAALAVITAVAQAALAPVAYRIRHPRFRDGEWLYMEGAPRNASDWSEIEALYPAPAPSSWQPTDDEPERLPTHGDLLAEINKAAHAAGTNAWVRDVLKRAHRAIRLSAPLSSTTSPAQALPMREALESALAFIDTVLVADENPTMSKRAVVKIIREALAMPSTHCGSGK